MDVVLVVTVLITLVAGRAAATVNPVWIVTLDLDCLIDQTCGTELVYTLPSNAMPVFGTVILVRVPAIRFSLADSGRMMVVWTTVCTFIVTILVTNVTDRPVTAIHVSIIVTPILYRIVLLVIRTGVMDTLPTRALPVFPAVIWVGIPAVRHVGAVHQVATVRGGGGTFLTVLVAFVTDRPLPTVCVLLVVTAIVDKVEHLWFPCGRVIRAGVVSSLETHTVPVLPAVVRVRVNTIAHLCAVCDMPTVWRGASGSLGRLGGTGGGVQAGAGTTGYRVCVAAETV